MNSETFCWELSKDLSLKAWKELVRNPYQKLYLYGDKDQDGVFIDFQVGDNTVGNKSMVIQEPIPSHYTFDILKGWFNERLRRCPIIPLAVR